MTDPPITVTPVRCTRVPEYDIARIVAIACVVLIHVTAPFMQPAMRTPVIEALSRGVRFAVPLFVLITGALLWTLPHGGSGSWRAFFRRRLSVVCVPYLAWSLIFIAFGAALGAPIVGSPAEVVRNLILGRTWYHLYFVPIIVGIYALAPVMYALYRRSPALLLTVSVVLGVLAPVALWELQLHPATPFRLAELVTRFVPYAAFGALYASRRERGLTGLRRFWPLFLAAGLGMCAWYTFGGGPLLSPYADGLVQLGMNVLASYGVLGLAAAVAQAAPAFTDRLAPYAASVFGVYLAHPLVLSLTERLGARLGVWPEMYWPWMLITWPLITFGGLWVVRALSRVRSLWWLHGVPARRAVRVADGEMGRPPARASVR